MDIKKVLFISQEIAPYLPESPMSVLGRDLPQSIQEKGYEVRTFMPKYGTINERRNQLHEVIRLSGMNIIIDDTDHPLIIKVATLLPSRMQVYFIDNDDYFQRHGSNGLEIATRPHENDERAMFFVRGVVETVKKLRWEPAFIHCQGWISALTPLYLKRMYAEDPSFRSSKIVYSLLDDKFDGTLDSRMAEKLSMDGFSADDLKSLAATDAPDYKALSKLAIDFADGIAQGAENVDPELLEYAKASGKPFLPLTEAGEDRAAAFAGFYESL
ncbi:MAG TPA: glycogen/starch synthase [Muribaculaceae bacterium]|jgi:starch synthase|nr:glycogen/starch synthase [Muribaculaceae bacterium]